MRLKPELHIVSTQRSNPSDHLALTIKACSKRAYNCHGNQIAVQYGLPIDQSDCNNYDLQSYH